MSYVLDALRRADAERRSGKLPTLHAQPATVAPADAADPARPRWLGPLIAALALALGGALVGWLWPRPTASPSVPDNPVVAQPPPAEVVAVAPRPVPPMPVPRRPPAAAPEPRTERAADDRPVALAELPDDLRRQLPAMLFGGATDSTQASARMLIVNGQIRREGDELAPGLVLEHIALRSAQMRFKGRRFEVRF